MRVSTTLAILVLVALAESSPVEDLYWEGDNDLDNEFLEVDGSDTGITSHLQRLKRQTNDWISRGDNDDKISRDEDIDGNEDIEVEGSGASDKTEPESKERAFLITFVVSEPYQKKYSDRDSAVFKTFKTKIADAVNAVYANEPGINRVSLIRIQSRPIDEFSCKVTLEIVTSSYVNNDRIRRILYEHIRNKRRLGDYTVNDEDFGFSEDPGNNVSLDTCAADELRCPEDGRCISSTLRCDSIPQCSDGFDERNCPDIDGYYDPNLDGDDEDNESIVPEEPAGQPQVPDSYNEVFGSENNIEDSETNTATDNPEGNVPQTTTCSDSEFRCDETRCIATTSRCDGYNDCSDGTDEASCNRENCGVDDFRCDNGRCIASSGRCNRIVECENGEDERECNCTTDDFKCVSDGSCIEIRKRCDGVPNCRDRSDENDCVSQLVYWSGDHVCKDSGKFMCGDGTCISIRLRCDGFKDCPHDGIDEQECPCSSDEWQCDHGSCIKRSKRCNGRVDCPTDRSDERNCISAGYFKCRGGKLIPEYQRCDRRYDCDPGDYSDEQNCPCGDGDFKCGNGFCIPASKKCDRTHDCQDGSDERECVYGTVCMAYQYKCTSGQCVPAESRCNGTRECSDNSDELNCPCKRGEFKCHDGSCINIAKRCNGRPDCLSAEDEMNCGTCMAYQYKCSRGECVPENARCNGTKECSDGSDELNCPCKSDQFKCRDGTCISLVRRCNGCVDCQPIGEDELYCGKCRLADLDTQVTCSSCPPDSFSCNPRSVVPCAKRCDGLTECSDGEDEIGCDECNHFCDGRCLEDSQICDQRVDCIDESDELNCLNCNGPNDFRCDNAECFNAYARCNGIRECADGSDELNCNNTQTPAPDNGCFDGQFRCNSGECIESYFRCDENNDCVDNSDEENCTWYMTRGSRSPLDAPCHESEFTCYDGRCIPHLRRCDNIYDCSDFSDEQKCYTSACQDGYYQCLSGQCIPNSDYCNGIPDCTDRSDESDCSTTFRPVTLATPPITTTTRRQYPQLPTYPEYNRCRTNEWRCENGPCIMLSQRCDGHVDCPHDGSDEFDCPLGTPVALDLKVIPEEQSARYGGDVVFACRDEGLLRAPVRWVREGGRSLKPGAIERKGRLEMAKVTTADSGVYICQAPSYLNYSGSEVRVTLTVSGPDTTARPVFSPCPWTQATCGNGQCISKSAICDGKFDCSDKTDEESCNIGGKCEPNQFQCANRKCVLKTWLCDSDDDCGDGSDEQNCNADANQSQCLPIEFACRSNDQCIPKSFHCDRQRDCIDHSDEDSCMVPTVAKPPSPGNLRLNPGETLELVCEAMGIPVPLISWRLNWGNVPPKCTSTSVGGYGTLTCHDMQPEDSGAYSCEGINNLGTVFAVRDSIVYVNRTDGVCPGGYFNSEARLESECIRCFCFGKSSQCQSADLFIFNLPSPLGEGGTRLVGVNQAPDGDIQIDMSQSITNQYYYLPLKNGATVTKLIEYNSAWSRSTAHPYLALPETYNGNQLTSYGGRINYRLSPHRPMRYRTEDGLPDIIIKGTFQTLVYKGESDRSQDWYVEARLTPNNWRKPTSTGFVPASREDIMMALDAVEVILLRAEFNNAGVNISEFNMESAQSNNVYLGVASLVEECTCPDGYKGRSCEKCADGYERQNSGPWDGTCVKKAPCPPMTYGDPNSGGDCKPCPCPLTNRENQFARGCYIGSRGDVICECYPGYEGPDCSWCVSGYVGNPLSIGDSCRPQPTNNCNPIGTSQVRPPDECVCKENVQGRYCDQCKNGSYYLSNDFRQGCALCFCSGVSQQCMISQLRRRTTRVQFNTPSIVEQVKVYSSAAIGPAADVRYNAPKETDLQPYLVSSGISINDYDLSPSILYWSLPTSFSGDKVTSYGGYLTYELHNVQSYSGNKNNAADVQLISDNSLTFHYFGNFVPASDGYLNASVQFLEKGWQRPDGKPVSREHFLLALADVKAILVKARYSRVNTEVATIVSASIETADENADGSLAQHVEICVCPTGYIGTSCEDCAPGYTRSSSGLYLELCDRCDCNGHSNMCHPETGICFECDDNTDGPNCERCKDGYERDQYNRCVYSSSTRAPTCNCDSRGEASPCSIGQCYCKQNVEGQGCDRCRPGTFGLDGYNPVGCTACYCSGVTKDCHEANHYSRIPLPAPIFGDDYGGYTIMDLNAEQVIHDQFMPSPKESELTYIIGDSQIEDLYWSLPVFPGNRVLSYGGSLSLTQKFDTGGYPDESQPGMDVVLVGDSISIVWRNPNIIRAGEALSYQVPLREADWEILNSPNAASRNDFMSVLKNLKRVLVRAILSDKAISTSIADVSMDTAAERYDSSFPAATGVEICMCPPGYSGTSCESCSTGFYKDQSGRCSQCNCNGHDCQLGRYGEVKCNCRPPYTGSDCSIVGLIMELHPTIQDDFSGSNVVGVTFTCKYQAPEPLSIQFYVEGIEVLPSKSYKESVLKKDGWHGENKWQLLWNKARQGDVYECRTISANGFTLGVLSTTLPEKGGESIDTTTTRPEPPPQNTIVVRITSPTIKIQKIGSTVNFTCEAQSQITPARLQVKWYKADGSLPQDRSQVDQRSGLLLIRNLQVSDSGKYICETNDGISSAQAFATLKVPVNDMTLPTVSISPSLKEYYEGDRIELTCATSGNPAPTVAWQRSSNRPLPRTTETYNALLIIENAVVEDSDEYRCIASNTAGTAHRTAIVTIRRRPSAPVRERLTVSLTDPTINEGRSIQVTCTGTPNIPVEAIEWIRQDGVDFLSNVRSQNGVLYIENAVPDNQGIYMCQAAPDFEVRAETVVLTVISTNTPSPEELSNITVSVDYLKIPTGGSGSIECLPRGYPLPQIKWTKHQGTFGPGTSQRENTLMINNAQANDTGYYLCEGIINSRLNPSIYVYVEIERREAPRVQIFPRSENWVTLGTQFELHCYVEGGIPEPVVTWSRNDGRALSQHVQILQNNRLSFQTVEVNDEGGYICTAANDAGSVSASSIIKVQSPPVINIIPKEYLKVVIGDPVEVQCRASGYPEPVVSIKSDRNIIVPPTPRAATLSILRVSEDGEYTCTATSAAGTTEERFLIRVDRGDGGDPDGSEYPDYDSGTDDVPLSLLAIEGQPSRITCNATDEFYVQWRRQQNQTLQSNAIQNGNELIIYDTSKGDTGIYECILINRRTGVVQQSVQTSLQVLSPPRIRLQPPTQTVHPGQSPTVECIVDGDDIRNVTWKPINALSSRVEIRGNALVFRQIEVEDAGKYECFASNRVANATAVAEVIVNEDTARPTESHDNEQRAHAGSSVHLSCNATRPRRVSWTKDGRNLPRSITRKTDGSLFIRLAQKSDSGRYVCLVVDAYGRQTSNYINLHIEGIECLKTQFSCTDGSGCVEEVLLCDGYNDCLDASDETNCIMLSDTNKNLLGDRDESLPLVEIQQPRRRYRVGEKVEVLCQAVSRDIKVKWQRPGTNQFVDNRVYGNGAVLQISGVQPSDAAIYRCIGEDRYGRTSYDDFNLEILPGSNEPQYPSMSGTTNTARAGGTVDLPCIHNLEEPANIEWRRENAQLASGFRQNERDLHLERITEADAGIYVCRVTNDRASVEVRTTLRVIGVVPKFNGNGWLTLPTLNDAYTRFDIEVSFKPADYNGIILYNSETNEGTGDYIILQLVDGVPVFTLKADASSPLIVKGDRPLQLNSWHTIRLSRTEAKVTMDVDNAGPFVEASNRYGVLDLQSDLYIGGAPSQRPPELINTSGFIGCISMLILGKEDKKIMTDSIQKYNVMDCDICSPNLCQNDGICQEARIERGYTCICPTGYAGLNCDRPGEACRPGLCGPGKCTDTVDGYKCTCPITYTGRNCDQKQNIEYPAFTGSAYLAIQAPNSSRILRMSMTIKPKAPVTDGIIMYCAQSPRGYGGFASLAVRNRHLEFRFDLGDGNPPAVLTTSNSLVPNEWTSVQINRLGANVTLQVDRVTYSAKLASTKDLKFETPMFVGGVDDDYTTGVVLNNNVGVTGGFSGCIKDVIFPQGSLNLINASIQSANVQECAHTRGDIPDSTVCSNCRNGGYCTSPDMTSCTCPKGYMGIYCELVVPEPAGQRPYVDPCSFRPCKNEGFCKVDWGSKINYTCDCPLGFGGFNCHMPLKLYENVGLAGNGYLELPSRYLLYDQVENEPEMIAMAFHTTQDGLLLYQGEAMDRYGGDYLLIKVERGVIVMEWDFGMGIDKISVDKVLVNDGDRHQLIAKIFPDGHVELNIDHSTEENVNNGISSKMNANSNIYIGGIPDYLNTDLKLPGFTGCIDQVEFPNINNRAVQLGDVAVAGRNAQLCKELPKRY